MVWNDKYGVYIRTRFLVASKQLYKKVRPSVGPWVRGSVRNASGRSRPGRSNRSVSPPLQFIFFFSHSAIPSLNHPVKPTPYPHFTLPPLSIIQSLPPFSSFLFFSLSATQSLWHSLESWFDRFSLLEARAEEKQKVFLILPSSFVSSYFSTPSNS